MKTYKVGIIGFGFIGKVHASGYINIPMYYKSLPFKTKITHICASRQESAQVGAEQVNAKFATTNFKEITENPDIDIVNICTPNNFHCEALLSAMKHNKNIYCDKPLVVNMQEAEKVQNALKDYNATSQMTLQNRFFPATIRAKQLIDDGVIGEILEFRANYLHAGSANPKAPLKWKLSASSGGGVIADLAPHIMDLVSWLIGDYDKISAITSIAYPKRPSADDPSVMLPVETEDCVMMLTKMKNGALGNIEATKIATGSEDEIRFEIHGSKGSLRFNGMDAHHLEYYNAGISDQPFGGLRGWTKIDTGQRYASPASFPGPKFGIGWIRSHSACLYNFLESVHSKSKGNPSLERGIYIQKLIEKVRESAKNLEWVKI